MFVPNPDGDIDSFEIFCYNGKPKPQKALPSTIGPSDHAVNDETHSVQASQIESASLSIMSIAGDIINCEFDDPRFLEAVDTDVTMVNDEYPHKPRIKLKPDALKADGCNAG